jgi:hypothetical protein
MTCPRRCLLWFVGGQSLPESGAPSIRRMGVRHIGSWTEVSDQIQHGAVGVARQFAAGCSRANPDLLL